MKGLRKDKRTEKKRPKKKGKRRARNQSNKFNLNLCSKLALPHIMKKAG